MGRSKGDRAGRDIFRRSPGGTTRSGARPETTSPPLRPAHEQDHARLRFQPGYNDFDDVVEVGSLWVTTTDTATVLSIDPTTVKVIGPISGFRQHGLLDAGDDRGRVGLGIPNHRPRGVVYRIDPYTNQIVKRIAIGYPSVAWPNGYILDAGGYVWTCKAGNSMTEIDPRTNRLAAWYTLPENCVRVRLDRDRAL